MYDMFYDIEEQYDKMKHVLMNIKQVPMRILNLLCTIQELQDRLQIFKEFIKDNKMMINISNNGRNMMISCFFNEIEVQCEFTENEEKSFFENIKNQIEGIYLYEIHEDTKQTFISIHVTLAERFVQIARIIELFERYTK